MDRVIISEAFDALHEYNNKSKKKNIEGKPKCSYMKKTAP